MLMLALFGVDSGSDLPPLPEWSTLDQLRYREEPRITPPMTDFVAREVAAGRCPMPAPADGHYAVTIDVAVLVGADGAVRATVPHAVDCPTVEQYSAGLVSAFARGNVMPRGATAHQWYRTTLTFAWTR